MYWCTFENDKLTMPYILFCNSLFYFMECNGHLFTSMNSCWQQYLLMIPLIFLSHQSPCTVSFFLFPSSHLIIDFFYFYDISFRLYWKTCNIVFPEPGLFCLTWWSPILSIFLQMAFCSLWRILHSPNILLL